MRRLDDRQATNALLEAQLDQPTREYGDAFDKSIDQKLQRFTPVRLNGQFLRSAGATPQPVVIANRTFEGAPGFWVVAPFRLDSGQDVAVLRGFANRALIATDEPERWAPPEGPLVIDGYLQSGSSGGVPASGQDVGSSDLLEINKLDLALLGEIWDVDFDPMYVVADRADRTELVAVDRPEISDGPHLSYAFQWFTFATIAGFGYLLIIRKMAGRPDASEIDAEFGANDANSYA